MLTITVFRVFCVLVLISLPAAALQDDKPTPFDLYKKAVEDYDALLDLAVSSTGRSEHKHVSVPRNQTDTRIFRGNSKSSWMEANRINYRDIGDAEIRLLRILEGNMIYGATLYGTDNLQKNERLAFWLNLHNLHVIRIISEVYPVKNTRNLLFKGKRGAKPVYEQPFARIDGRDWSLADIERHVFTTWPKTLVMYGFYYGSIGSPNIRTSAYTGSKIWSQLRDNALDFVNSIRGTQTWGKTLKVSEHYGRARDLFPDFQTRIKSHVLELIQDAYWRDKILKTTRVSATVKNHGIADFHNGHPFSTSIRDVQPMNMQYPTFFMGQSARGGLETATPHHLNRLVLGVEERYKRKDAEVTIETVSEGDGSDVRGDSAKDTDEAPQPETQEPPAP